MFDSSSTDASVNINKSKCFGDKVRTRIHRTSTYEIRSWKKKTITYASCRSERFSPDSVFFSVFPGIFSSFRFIRPRDWKNSLVFGKVFTSNPTRQLFNFNPHRASKGKQPPHLIKWPQLAAIERSAVKARNSILESDRKTPREGARESARSWIFKFPGSVRLVDFYRSLTELISVTPQLLVFGIKKARRGWFLRSEVTSFSVLHE